jgi:hypothetical protein
LRDCVCEPKRTAAAEKPPTYLVVANVDFAEGPIFDSRGNLYFVNYLRNGTIGKMARHGTVFIRYVWAVGVGEMIYARTTP